MLSQILAVPDVSSAGLAFPKHKFIWSGIGQQTNRGTRTRAEVLPEAGRCRSGRWGSSV